MTNTKKCSTPSCDEQVYSARLCKKCYSGHYYWSKKGVAAQQARRLQLTILSERLEDIRPANVIAFRRKRRA